MSTKQLIRPSIACIAAAILCSSVAFAQEVVESKDGKGVIGYKDTPILPWCGFHKHDPDRPLPPEVRPGEFSTQRQVGSPPSDAIVLFDGKDMSKWQPNKWKVADGTLECTEGDIKTLESFGDCQLHIEWAAPNPPRGPKTSRGNSGVFFMDLYEIQIADSYTEKVYPDGSAAAVYGETPPLVNATRPPGEWQVYDIIFTAPQFKDGKVAKPATVTMFHNNLLVHFNTEIHGPCEWRSIRPYAPHPEKLPLRLQAHGNPVRFRNIWIRPLDLAAATASAPDRQ
jgi:hypothetical protein